MEHTDHLNLLRPAGLPQGGTWADFGAGEGAFTLALRELTGPDAVIYAVDRDGAALRRLKRDYIARFGSPLRGAQGGADNLILLPNDFSRPLDLPPLDGIVMANSLHYFREKEGILRHVRGFLKPNGVLLLVDDEQARPRQGREHGGARADDDVALARQDRANQGRDFRDW